MTFARSAASRRSARGAALASAPRGATSSRMGGGRSRKAAFVCILDGHAFRRLSLAPRLRPRQVSCPPPAAAAAARRLSPGAVGARPSARPPPLGRHTSQRQRLRQRGARRAGGGAAREPVRCSAVGAHGGPEPGPAEVSRLHARRPVLLERGRPLRAVPRLLGSLGAELRDTGHEARRTGSAPVLMPGASVRAPWLPWRL